MPKIAATIIGPTEEGAIMDMIFAKIQGADIIEIRRDFFDSLNLERITNYNSLPKIFTCRNKAEAGPARGAGFRGTEGERRALYEEAVSLRFDYLDIEDEHYKTCAPSKLGTSKLILSWHDFSCTPDWAALLDRFESMRDKNPYIIKMATMANSFEDNRTMLDFSDYLSKDYPDQKKLLMTMGPKCKRTRVYGPKFGSEWIYACLEGKPASAGQPTIRGLRRVWERLGIR